MAFTLAQPAYGQAGSYTALQDRFMLQAMSVTPGVRRLGAASGTVMTGDLAVTTTGATDSKVNVAAGDVFVYGGSGLGVYHAYNDAAILSSAFASCPTNSRIDLVTIQVTDTGAAAPSIAVAIVTGTAAATPSAPATPAKAIALAQVTIPNGFVSGSTAILAANIKDVRPKAQLPDFSVPSLANNLNSGRVDTPYTPVSGNIIFDTSVGSVKAYSNYSLLGTSTSSTLIGTGSKTFTTQAGLSLVAGQRVRLVSRAGVEANPLTTSSSSVAIGTGSKAFTVPAGLTFVASRVRVQSLANPANFVEGTFTYATTTLTVTVDTTGGSGTFTDWLVSNVQNYMEGAITSYTTTSLVVTVDATSGAGTLADWLIYGPAWEQPVKALASGVHDGTYRFVPQILAPSTATPLLPVEGNQWFQTDTGLLFIYDGSAWVQMAAPGAWTSWTPTYTGITQGTGAVNTGAYTRNGKLVQFYASLTLGTSPLYASAIYINLPVGTTASRVNGQVIANRTTAFYSWFLMGGAGVTQAQISVPGTGYVTAATAGAVSGTFNTPAGILVAAAGDKLDFTGWYVTT